MKKFQIIIYIVLTILLTSSCKTLNTNLSIPKKKIPSSFNTRKDTVSVGSVSWREYFNDTLLIKLIDTALVNNFDLQIALQRIEIANSGVRISTGKLFPKIEGNISAGIDKYGKYTPDYLGNSTTEYEPGKTIPNPSQNYFLGLTTSWEIDIWGKLKNQRKATISNYLASIEGKNFVQSNLVANIAGFYYQLISLDKKLKIIKQTIKKQKKALEVVQLQKEIGQVNELVVQQFKAELLNSQSLKKEKQQQIVQMENKVNFLLGRFPQTIKRNKKSLFKEVPKQIALGIPSQLLLNRSDIRGAELQVQASKFDLKTAKATFLPTINLSGALGFQALNTKFLFNPSKSIGYSALGSLVAPLVNMKALKAQFNTAKSNQLIAMYNYQKSILNGYVEVVNELTNLKNLQQIRSLKKEQSKILDKSVETSTELYKVAKANYLEVLMAHQNSLQVKFEVIDVYKKQQIAIVNIYKALGGGWR